MKRNLKTSGRNWSWVEDESRGNVIEVATAPSRFSDVRIYSKALSAEEVKQL